MKDPSKSGSPTKRPSRIGAKQRWQVPFERTANFRLGQRLTHSLRRHVAESNWGMMGMMQNLSIGTVRKKPTLWFGRCWKTNPKRGGKSSVHRSPWYHSLGNTYKLSATTITTTQWYLNVPSGKLTWQWKMDRQWKGIPLLKMGNVPACHVSSTECMLSKLFGLVRVKVSLIPRPETDEHVDCKNMSTR